MQWDTADVPHVDFFLFSVSVCFVAVMNFSNAMLYFLPLFHDLLFPFCGLDVAFALLGSAFSNLNSLQGPRSTVDCPKLHHHHAFLAVSTISSSIPILHVQVMLMAQNNDSHNKLFNACARTFHSCMAYCARSFYLSNLRNILIN